MVDKFRTILERLEEKGHVSLFVVLRMDDFVNKWSVVICADWANPRDIEAFNFVLKAFNELLTQEELSLIARISIFNLKDYIPQLFIKYKTGDEIKQETKINGFVVYEGYILKSQNLDTTHAISSS